MTSLVPGTSADLTRGKAELPAENALLRHQLIILRRQIKRPVYRKIDRVLLVFSLVWFRPGNRRSLSSSRRRISRGPRELFRVFTEAHIESPLEQDHQVDEGDGSQQPPSSGRSAFEVSCSS